MANNEKQGKDTFILRCEFYPQIKRLEREQRGDLLDAIFAHATDTDYPLMDGVTSMCFEFIRASMDSYAGRYDAKCLKNRENGMRGGRPRKADGNDSNQMDGDNTEYLHENQADDVDCERLIRNPAESEKTEWFANKPNNARGDANTEYLHENTANNDNSEWLKTNQAKNEKTERFILNPIDSEKTKRVEKNHDSDSDSDSDPDPESDNTHTLIFENKGGVGENFAAAENSAENIMARNLIAWVEANVPTIADMAEPITEQNAVWMLRKHCVEDIQRIILAMHNKRAFENVSAYATFTNFVKYDKQLNDGKADTSSESQPYTWAGILAYIDKHPGTTTDDFERQMVKGRPVWFKKSDMQTK